MKSDAPTDKLTVFISYAREDKYFVEQFKEILLKHNIKVWMDESDLRPLEEWEQEIKNAILVHDYVIFIASRSSTVKESYCRKELSFAKENNKVIIPINIDPKLNWLPDEIRDINWIDFSLLASIEDDNKISLDIENDEFNRYFDLLLAALETDLDWVKKFTKLLQKSWEWAELNKDESYLLIGNELDDFQDALKRYEDTKPRPISSQIEFLAASEEYRQNENKKQKRNIKRLKLLIVSVSILLLVAGVFAFINWRQNITGKARELANISESIKDDADTSLLLSLKAFSLAKTTEAQNAIFSAIGENNYVAKLFRVGSFPLVAVGNDKLVMASCIERGDEICLKSEMRLVDLETFEDIVPSIQVEGNLHLLQINRNQDRIVVLAINNENDEVVHVYSMNTGEFHLTQTFHTNPFSMTFGSQDNEIIIGTSAGKIEFWNIESGIQYRDSISIHGENITDLVFNEEKNLLYSIDQYGILEWDLNESKPDPQTFKGFSNEFGNHGVDIEGNASVIDPGLKLSGTDDGRWLISKGKSGIIIWDAMSRESKHYIRFNGVNQPYSGTKNMAFFPDSSTLLYTSTEGKVYGYDIANQVTIGSYEKKGMYDINISKSGRFIVISLENGNVIIYDSWGTNRFIEASETIELKEYAKDVAVVNDTIIVGENGGFYLIDLSKPGHKDFFEQETSVSFALAPSGQQVAVGFTDGTVKIVEARTNKVQQEIINKNKVLITKLFFSPDGDSIYAIDRDGLIRKIDSISGKIEWEYQYPYQLWPDHFSVSKISPDGKYIISPTVIIEGQNLWLINLSDRLPTEIAVHSVTDQIEFGTSILNFGFSPDSRLLAFSVNADVYIYDIKKEKIIQIIKRNNQDTITGIEFLDKNHIFLVSTSGELINSASTGLRSFKTQWYELFDISKGLQTGVIYQPDDDVIFHVQSIGNQKILSASLNGKIRIWDFSDEQIQKAACNIADRELTLEEWEKYIGNFQTKSPLCSSTIQANEILTENDFSVSKISTILGKNLGEEIVLAENARKEMTVETPTSIQYNIQNDISGLSYVAPAIIQCRDSAQRTSLVNQFLFYWPLSISKSKDSHIWNIDVEGYWSHPDNSIKKIDLSSGLPPGVNQLILPVNNILGKVIDGPDADNSILQLHAKTIEEYDDPESFIDGIVVENLIGHKHVNVYDTDQNYPMHTLQLSLKNNSDHDVIAFVIYGVVYNENDQAIDLLINFYSGTPVLESGSATIIIAKSLSTSGRCVGPSNLSSSFRIAYFLGIEFANETNIYPYGTLYGEYNSKE